MWLREGQPISKLIKLIKEERVSVYLYLSSQSTNKGNYSSCWKSMWEIIHSNACHSHLLCTISIVKKRELIMLLMLAPKLNIFTSLFPVEYKSDLSKISMMPIMVKCKSCPSVYQMDRESFEDLSVMMTNHNEDCPHCGNISTYNKPDYSFIEVKWSLSLRHHYQ